ncbi:MAG: hypothetical protein WKG07_26405 [Hymenobacter sp.]
MEFKPPFIDVTYHREEFVYCASSRAGCLQRKARAQPAGHGGHLRGHQKPLRRGHRAAPHLRRLRQGRNRERAD